MLFHALLKVSPGEHDPAVTRFALNTNVSANPVNGPLFPTARMRLLHDDTVTDCKRSALLSTGRGHNDEPGTASRATFIWFLSELQAILAYLA